MNTSLPNDVGAHRPQMNRDDHCILTPGDDCPPDNERRTCLRVATIIALAFVLAVMFAGLMVVLSSEASGAEQAFNLCQK